MGEATISPAFWSQAVASQFAATRGRQRAADDEAEEARAGGGHGGRRADLVQQRENSARIRLVGGERLFKLGETSEGIGRGTHTALVQALPVAFGARRRIVE